jgi:iron complex transport system substrate-binding protein
VRIVSFVPSATEILYALGLGDSVVGVTHACDYPPEALAKPRVTRSNLAGVSDQGEIDRSVRSLSADRDSLAAIDLEVLKRLSPELLFAQGLCHVCGVTGEHLVLATQLLKHKPRIVTLSPETIEGVLGDIHRIGRATGRVQEAQGLAAALEVRILFVRKRTAGLPRPTVVCLEWMDPLMIGGHWVPQMVRLAGGRDPLGAEGKPSTRVSWEAVVEAGPEVLFLIPCGVKMGDTIRGVASLRKLPGWDDLPAIQKARVYALDGPSYFNRSGPRIVDGLEIMGGLIHPGLFSMERFLGAYERVTGDEHKGGLG